MKNVLPWVVGTLLLGVTVYVVSKAWKKGQQ